MRMFGKGDGSDGESGDKELEQDEQNEDDRDQVPESSRALSLEHVVEFDSICSLGIFLCFS